MSEFLLEHKYVQVPVEFIEKYLVEANGAYVKVYLYILNLAEQAKPMQNAEIAEKLSLIESDVIHALDYWKNLGVIKEVNGKIIIGSGEGEITPPAELENNEGYRVAEEVKQNHALYDMMQLAQEIFGRILSNSEMETLYWFYDELHFSPEAILLLLEFCVSKGKNSMKYIEKVALAWSERGATEADKVYEIIKEDEQKNGYLYSIRKVMGILDRNLSQSEEQFLLKWRNEKGMSEEMVALAYEYCIIQTAKLSFPYMDKIIERWFKEGISDIVAAEEDNKKFKAKSAPKKEESTDYTDLENLTRKRNNE